jgi:hypothetical protein
MSRADSITDSKHHDPCHRIEVIQSTLILNPYQGWQTHPLERGRRRDTVRIEIIESLGRSVGSTWAFTGSTHTLRSSR